MEWSDKLRCMSARYVNVDRRTPMLLPCDLREWVAENDMVHFVISAVEDMALDGFRVNHRGTGSKRGRHEDPCERE